ncbi:4Fe-4S binding domain-containing protein [Desulfocicer vacuolatum DSM 3385]|uniref:4Fe-4S binding domain-containing protein n=1 Tax=Desulfocicer vacuolatum DSM 3385 TaxID=1121400 RepID=A0A1W1YSF2_9BACT|nr:4Fe-4S binding protein [Desulfocicer vacuolatum]SMC38751.1 4Fe-4S binding domain-containing protein [Desulfocicer vacuolatum DSM 3385]
MKVLRKIIEIDEEKCDGCGNCVPSCAEGAIQIIDGKAKVIKDQYCDGLGACLGECPQDALKLVEREADEFDEAAVEAFLEEQKKQQAQQKKAAPKLDCGCASTHLKTFPVAGGCQEANKPVDISTGTSALSHWPVQIRLIPPTAPFLKDADLLITADCAAVSAPSFHNDYLKGKVVMMGCPKFDDVDSYVEKFAQIFKVAGIKSITTLIMEVPCCSGLPGLVEKAMALAGVEIPMEQVVISARGDVVQ